MNNFYKVGHLKLNAVLMAALLCSGVTFAAEKQEACVKQQQEQGWTRAEAVIVTVMSGAELNAVVGGYTQFRASQTYAVLVDNDQQVNILTLSPHAMGQLPFFEQEVKDQLGNKWRVKSGHWLCY
ncbi:MAG: hypothetical protein L3J38_01365 [Thiomicrorhabdus sp.]|nr:hypothetical protein [Thiomicrorhabdus sp.]